MDDPNYIYADYQYKPDPDHRPLYLTRVERLLRPLSKGSTVLDAGCGGGLFSEGLKQIGYEVCGADLNESAIEAAKRRGVGRFKVASVYDDLAAPFDRESLPAILCIEVIEHLYSPLTFVKRAYDALEPGGMLIVSTPYWGYLKNIALAVTNRTDRSLTANWEGGHIKHFSRRTLGDLMRRAGFEVSTFEGTGEGWRATIPWLWSGMLMSFRKPLSGNAGMEEHDVS